MREELGLTIGARYSVCLLLIFPGYVVFEIPSDWALVRFGVWKTMTALIVSWGLIVMGMGFVKHWSGLAVLRLFLGVFEARIFPGAVYLISSWYRRYEVHRRIAGLYTIWSYCQCFCRECVHLISCLTLVLAYAISKIDGKQGYRGWRWVSSLKTLTDIDFHPRRCHYRCYRFNLTLPPRRFPRQSQMPQTS